MDEPTLIFLPGFGADKRLFQAQAEVFDQLHVPDWLEPHKRESLADYAARWGGQLREQFGDRPVCLGGVSMGGMLALEMAAALKPRCVMLVSSCRSRNALAPGMYWFARFTAYLPNVWIAGLRNRLPRSFHEKIGPLAPDLDKLTRDMFADTPTPLLRWGCHAMTTWRGKASCDPVPCWHIHGTQDDLIRSGRVEPDEWIEGASHAPVLTHPQAVNDFIRRCLDRCGDAAG